jgi:hypothetical protein
MHEEKPKFEHDCEKCVFLGRWYTNETDDYDFYWCDKLGLPNLASVIARYGNEGREYLSSHPPGAFADPNDYWLKSTDWYRELIRRALAKGLYTQEDLCRSLRPKPFEATDSFHYVWQGHTAKIHLIVRR